MFQRLKLGVSMYETRCFDACTSCFDRKKPEFQRCETPVDGAIGRPWGRDGRSVLPQCSSVSAMMGKPRFPLIGKGDIDAEGAAGIDAHFGAGGHIERALPEAGEVVKGILQAVGGEVGGAEAEDGHFGAHFEGERDLVDSGIESAEVADHAHARRGAEGSGQETGIVHEQGDIGQGVVFAAACSAEQGEVTVSQGEAVVHGFGQVVGLLVEIDDETIGPSVTHGGADAVAVAHDEVGGETGGQAGIGRSIAAGDEMGAAQVGEGVVGGGEEPGGEDDGVHGRDQLRVGFSVCCCSFIRRFHLGKPKQATRSQKAKLAASDQLASRR